MKCYICNKKSRKDSIVCSDSCNRIRLLIIQLSNKYTPTNGCDNCWGDLGQGCTIDCKQEFKKSSEFIKDMHKLVVLAKEIKPICTCVGTTEVKNIAAVIIEKKSDYPILFFLGLINSKLFTYYIDEQSPKSSNKSYPSFNSRLLKSLPIVNCSQEDKEKISTLSQELLKSTTKFNSFKNQVLSFVLSKSLSNYTSNKLKNWQELVFINFLKEIEILRKEAAKKNSTDYNKLSLNQEAEWMQYFNVQKEIAQAIKSEIDKTDCEIDKMVYELYGLTDEEIKIVEGAV